MSDHDDSSTLREDLSRYLSAEAVSSRSESDIEIIQGILNELYPLDSDVLGSETIREIAAGASFKSSETGRRLDLLTVVNTLASVATLTQCVILAATWLRKRGPADGVDAHSWVSLIRETLRHDDRFKSIVDADPSLLEHVARVVASKMGS